jgi:hypothetical protein
VIPPPARQSRPGAPRRKNVYEAQYEYQYNTQRGARAFGVNDDPGLVVDEIGHRARSMVRQRRRCVKLMGNSTVS